jgi:hypothetical protein
MISMVEQGLAIEAGAAQVGRRDLVESLPGSAANAGLASVLVVIVDDGETLPALTLLLASAVILPLLPGTCLRLRLLLRLSLWRL